MTLPYISDILQHPDPADNDLSRNTGNSPVAPAIEASAILAPGRTYALPSRPRQQPGYTPNPCNSTMPKSHNSATKPAALLLMGTHCPYCPGVLKSLQALLASGDISELETRNIEENPEIARELGVRSVPWVRIGSFELEGLRSEKELRDWAIKAASDSGGSDWLNELLASGNIRVRPRIDGRSAGTVCRP